MIRTATLFALAALAAPAHAGALRSPVMDLLNAYEDTASGDELRALGEGVDAELMEIADDKAVPISRRARAISSSASPSAAGRWWRRATTCDYLPIRSGRMFGGASSRWARTASAAVTCGASCGGSSRSTATTWPWPP